MTVDRVGNIMTGDMRSWESVLDVNDKRRALFSEAFLADCGHVDWTPVRSDMRAAAALHIELTSRISTQPLGYSDGVEASALASLHALFERTRKICHRHLRARHFEQLVWPVLNNHVRPFMARWHRRADAGELRALDQTDIFREQLATVQDRLRALDQLLLFLRDGVEAAAPSSEPNASDTLERELAAKCAMGLIAKTGDDQGLALTAARSAAETNAIAARRTHYGLPADAPAIGLALSGGGIRSATFSLGVLMGLAQRGVLDQVDYLSTVSGGGYLGCSLVNFLAGDTPPAGSAAGLAIGLRKNEQPFGDRDRQSRAIGHIRQNSRYLVAGTARKRVEIGLIQLAGLLTNLLTLAAMVTLARILVAAAAGSVARVGSAIATSLPGLFGLQPAFPPAVAITGALLFLMLLLAPLIARFVLGERLTNQLLFAVALLLVGSLIDPVLSALQTCWATLGTVAAQSVVIALLIPLGLLAIGILAERMLPWGKIVGRLLAQIAAPAFLLLVFLVTGMIPLGIAAAVSVGVLVLSGLTLDLNFTGLHRAYRDMLGAAFLVRANDETAGVAVAAATKLSELRTSDKGPYPIINCALNVPASSDPRMRGRLTDFFSFTPDFCGSPLTGYDATTAWETANQDLTLATAMAVSGAAIAPRMGLNPNTTMGFWMALLNIRLDWWIKKPGSDRWLTPSADYLLRELSGRIDERGSYLNLSDGGHIENLGVYELLKRRCKYIIAVDGEQDEQMTFHALANLQRLAAIDLDIAIEMDLDDLRRDPAGFSRSHFQFCRVRYPDGAVGFLTYLKLSITGNEGEFLRRFKLDEPDFPHHPTLDQNFTETRFEAYRGLGEHVADKLFLGSIVGKVAEQSRVLIPEWFAAIARSLLA
jgi:hypothetical protein